MSILSQPNNLQIIDLTHTLNSEIPWWLAECAFKQEIVHDYNQPTTGNFKVRAQKITMSTSAGTHMDAPAHFIPGGKTIDQISVEKFIAPCVVIDVSTRANENYLVSQHDIISFEEQYEKIPANTFVVFYTGWDTYWQQPSKYHNNHKFPAISADVAQMLLARNIVGIGIDTLSPDRPESDFIVHRMVLGAEKYIVENIANAGSLPPIGSTVIVLPIKNGEGTEAPVRMIAILD